MTLNLAFLNPEIVRAAVEGTLPNYLGSSRLAEASVNWREQGITGTDTSGPSRMT
jgi:site-specific DNA recombinase